MKHYLNKKTGLLIAALLLVLLVSVGGTLAYLVTKTDPVVNTFEPAEIPISVQENLVTNGKQNVTIRNDGDVAAYIRAQIIVTWQDGNGNVHAIKPVQGKDYTLNINTGDWTGDDGIYYYNHKLPATGEDVTKNLINSCTVLPGAKIPVAGYALHVEIIAQAIQADGWPDSVTSAKDAFDQVNAQ